MKKALKSNLNKIFFILLIYIFTIIIAFFPNRSEANGFSIMCSELLLSGQSRWYYYNGGDSPEGGFIGRIIDGENSLDGTIVLGRTLQPGQYYVSLKVIDYSGNGQIEVSLDGEKASTQPDNRDFNRYWTLPITINVTSPTNSIKITLLKTIAVNTLQQYLLIGLYITSDPGQIVDRYDRIINLNYPSEMDNSPPVKGNLIENSSFEVGIGHGWGLDGTGRTFSIKSLWDNTVSYHGKASLKVPPTRRVISKVYRVRPNKMYTLSAWVRASKNAGITLEIESPFEPIDGYPSPVKLSKNFPIDTNWQRVSISGFLLEYPTSDYQFKFLCGGSLGNYVWIDAVQLEEGELSDYNTKKPLEIGLKCDNVSNIFFNDETISMDLLAYNNSDQEISANVQYEIYDFMNQKVKQGTQEVNASPNNISVCKLDLSSGKRGIFRVALCVENEDGTQEEVAFSVLPRPSNLGLDENSIIGIHTNYNKFQLNALQKMGIKWTRAMSPGAFFRWSKVEPIEGEFIWHDEEIQDAINYGLTVMGTIGTNNYWPGWADNNGLPDLAKWENFVEQIVNHYKNNVKYWEIWNESIFAFSTEFYAQLLKVAADAIHRADPEAKIIGMGGVSKKDWILEVIGHLGDNWKSYMDFISTHLYPPASDPMSFAHGKAAAEFNNSIIEPYNMPVWNTETGAWDHGFYKGSNSNFVNYGEAIWPHTDAERYYRGSLYETKRVVKNFLHCIGNGISRYFYYDSRIYASPEYFISHPTILEYDETIRCKGTAYSILAHFFDYSKGLGDISPDSNTYSYLFNRNGTPLVSLWSQDQTNKAISLNLQNSQFKAYDIMGNLINTSDSTIPYNGTPIYIEGQGITIDALKAAIQGGVISNRSDNTPPNLSIVSAPSGPITDNSFRVRWIAIDDTSIPITANPEAILYSCRLEGYNENWSDWTAKTFVNYSNIPSGSYIFAVKAKDQQGNISSLVSRQIIISSSESSKLPAPQISILKVTKDN